MISYPSRKDLIQRVYDHKQEHIFAFWDRLSDAGKSALLDDAESID